MSGSAFFSELPEITAFADVVSRDKLRAVPDDWHVVITDVKGSTKAIQEGRYRDVNALGVASIIALRNALPGVDLPYVFGGDGATLLIPESCAELTDRTLRGLRRVAVEAYEMELRCSRVSVQRLRKEGHECQLGRFRMSPHVALAVLSGQGYSVAEEWIKSPVRGGEFQVSEEGPAHADLEGFECRWKPSPSERGRVMSLLVVATGNAAGREQTYRAVIDELGRLGIAGDAPPLSVAQMHLKQARRELETEAKMVSGTAAGVRFEAVLGRARKQNRIARLLELTGLTAGGWNAKRYKSEFLQNTDYRKFDEALRMILDVTEGEAESLERFLKQQHQTGHLAYGIHLSASALITCMVRSYSGDHVHFVDGSDGGYALAARGLKAQLKALG